MIIGGQFSSLISSHSTSLLLLDLTGIYAACVLLYGIFDTLLAMHFLLWHRLDCGRIVAYAYELGRDL